MRKMFWCSCFVMVAAAVGVYLASHHHHHHTAQSMVQRVGQAVAQQVGGAAMAVAHHETGSGENCETVPPQIIDVCQPRVIINEEELEDVATNPATTVVPACIEECELMPMPPCQDEESEATGEKKVAEDACPIADFWMSLFRDLMKDKDQDAVPPAAEEADAVDEGVPADCQEDKDYHQRYPSCPYMGGCPGSRSACPPSLKKDQEVDEPIVEEEIAEPRPAPETTDEAPTHPDVDTMEFRPSDAPPKENDPQQIG